MALDAAILDQVRDWVGSTPDDATIEARYNQSAGDEHPVEATALAILRRRRADMVASPAEWRLDGDYQQKTEANIAALDAQIADLERIVATGGGMVTTSQLVRCDTGR